MTSDSMPEVKISKFADLFDTPIRNGLFKPTYVRGKGVKMVNMGEIFSHGRIDDLDMELVPLTEQEREKFLLKKGDLLFARASLAEGAGKCCIFIGNEQTTFESHVIRVRIDPELADPRFYYYYFNSTAGKQLTETIVEKTAASGIRASDLSNLIVPYPDKRIQKRIADFGEIIDEEIELNQQMNCTLEAVGEAVFKRWFVDFEFPNEQGKPYKSSGGEMIDSEMGKIPGGWKSGNLSTICDEITDGSHFSPREDPKGEHLIATVRNMDLFDFNLETCKRISEEDYLKLVRDGCKPEPNDILFSKDGTMGITFRYLGHQDVVLLSSIAIIRPKNLYISNYLYCCLKDKKTQESIFAGYVSGSALPRIVVKDLKRVKIIIPIDDLLAKFAENFNAFFELIIQNCCEIYTLKRIRDLLLPKLMSGKVRVPIEKQEA